MQNRRDHVHAYQFAVSRLSTALTGADPGTGEAPFRLAGLGLLLGTVIAILISAAAAIFGWLDPASTTWRQPGAIVVEKETGTRFLYLGGMLHPTLNYTSARLIAGNSASITYLPSSALDAVRVGYTIGILGAPESLPPATSLLPGRWTDCLAPGNPGGVALSMRAGRAAGLGGMRVLVIGPHGEKYVVWDNVKYPLPERSAVVALGFGNYTPAPAPAVWLQAVRTGPALAAPAVPGAGRPGVRIAGRRSRLGQLFESTSGGVHQYYVMLSDGLSPLSRTVFTLLAAVPRTAPPTQVSPASIAATPVSADRQMLSGLPNLLSDPLYQPDGLTRTLCVRQVSPGRPGRGIVVTEPASESPVDVPANAALLVQPPGASGAAYSAVPPQYLISSSGLKYPLGSGAVTALGYPDNAVRVMPASLLRLVPDGPTLSAAQAEKAVTWASG